MCVYSASFLITIEPCYALFVLSMPNNTAKSVNPLDHDMHLKKWTTQDI